MALLHQTKLPPELKIEKSLKQHEPLVRIQNNFTQINLPHKLSAKYAQIFSAGQNGHQS